MKNQFKGAFALVGLFTVLASAAALAAQPKLMLRCRDKDDDRRIEARVLGPHTIARFELQDRDGEEYITHEEGEGPFDGATFESRNSQWKNYLVYEGLTGRDCIRATCTKMVLPRDLTTTRGRVFPVYVVTTSDNAGGHFGMRCKVEEQESW